MASAAKGVFSSSLVTTAPNLVHTLNTVARGNAISFYPARQTRVG